MYSLAKAAKIVGRSGHTLQRWDRDGTLKAFRTKNNRRYYTEEQLQRFLGHVITKETRTVAYCRVSSQGQKSDLKNQRKCLEEFCVVKGIANVEFIEEIGGGLNFNRPGFMGIVNDIISGKVTTLILAHKDRLCRFGFELVSNICKEYGCEILVLNSESMSPEQEMVQDLMTIIHCFSSRLYGLRNYRKSLKKAIEEDK